MGAVGRGICTETVQQGVATKGEAENKPHTAKSDICTIQAYLHQYSDNLHVKYSTLGPSEGSQSSTLVRVEHCFYESINYRVRKLEHTFKTGPS